MAAKLVVTAAKGGSRISLVGASGTELLSSKMFSEPRAKGATLRALKGLLGENVVVEDRTLASTRKTTVAAPARQRRAATAAVLPNAPRTTRQRKADSARS